jgi:hypothetical protein
LTARPRVVVTRVADRLDKEALRRRCSCGVWLL